MLATPTITWKNPVYPHYFADPFVLKFADAYYAYGTAPASADGNQFPVLRSDDLAHWEYLSHALLPINNPPGVNYWAPEVAHRDGVFYLYYSATTSTSDEHHRLRVATSRAPEGPFTDSGNLLLPDSGFSIDAHPFCDPKTGKWYLFFAADYTDEEPYGTGLAVAPLSDDLTWVTEKPRPIVRASAPWQVYEHNRNYKGRLWQAWNCVEGPFVLYHQGKYYCLYSGGAWNSENYGLGFAVADHPLGRWKDDFAKNGPTVLKGIANETIGPGHNSIVIGPDGHTQFVVYHAWDKARAARRMCIDVLQWTKDGPRCVGPTATEQHLSM